jgi:hypothetical protein
LNDIVALGGRASLLLVLPQRHVEHPGKGPPCVASGGSTVLSYSFFESRDQFGGGNCFQGSTRD